MVRLQFEWDIGDKMGVGLQVFTETGKLIFDSEWGRARILGTIVVQPSTPTGQYTVPSMDGQQYKIFAYKLPFSDVVVNRTVRDEVKVTGNVITWKNLTFPVVNGTAQPIKIVFGDGYK